MYVVFGICAAAVLGALGFVTAHVLRLERREQATQAAAKADESIRLALWRMDSAVNAIIAKEAARPYFEYQPFYVADRAYTKMFEDVRPGEVLVPSPLLLGAGDYIKLHFQRLADGSIVSPQVPTGNMRDLAESAYVESQSVIDAEDRLHTLAALITRPAETLGGARDAATRSPAEAKKEIVSGSVTLQGDDTPRGPSKVARSAAPIEPPQSLREYEARSQSANLAANSAPPSRVVSQQRALASGSKEAEKAGDVSDRSNDFGESDKQVALQRATMPSALSTQDESKVAAADGNRAEPEVKREPADRASSDTNSPTPVSPSSAAPAVQAPAATPSTGGVQVAHAPAPSTSALAKPDAAARAKAASAPGSPSAKSQPTKRRTGGGGASESADRRADAEQLTERKGADSATPSSPPAPRAERVISPVAPGSGIGVDPSPLGLDALKSGIQGLAYQPEPAIELTSFAPAWVTISPRELVYMRTVHTTSTTLDQGLWIDWPRLVAFLQQSTADLVPGAEIRPISIFADGDAAALGRRLASLPAELHWTPPTIAPVRSWTPARTTLVLTWIATLVAIGAIGLVLHSSTDLAERRGRFVSAVTHELRTPLTTFVMYSQMLADGMVTSDDARRDYLQTLKSEATRLSRIVENVLEYARLGRKKKSVPCEPIHVADLVARIEPALQLRAQQCGTRLVVESPGPCDATVRADSATVERILYNLVDNACKYACASPARENQTGSSNPMPVTDSVPGEQACTKGRTPLAPITLSLHLSSHAVTFSVRDQGPGIPATERPRIFKPFHRGAHHSDGSIPGLGLGLALARGLAHTLGGTLDLHPTSVGTQIDLTLPLATSG